MSTGLLVRDFHKDEREVRYSNSGSIRFTGIEHNAYRLSLTLEITHIDAPRYGNKKTLPDNTHYGYASFFKGSTVIESVAVKFPKFRLFDILNQGIWNYHQATETVQIVDALSEALFSEQSNFILEVLESATGVDFCSVVNFALPGGEGSIDELFRVLVGCDDFNEPGFRPLSSQYRGFPVGSPFPDVVKFKGDVPLSFLFRLESWYLVNPSVYIVDNPTDTGDQTDGEDEYPEPDSGDGDGDGSEFPAPNSPDSSSDPRDYSYPPDAAFVYRVTVSGEAVGASGTIVSYSGVAGEFQLNPNALPLTADASDSPSNAIASPQTYFGLEIRDRFGQLVNVFAPVVSFPKGGHSVTIELIS